MKDGKSMWGHGELWLVGLSLDRILGYQYYQATSILNGRLNSLNNNPFCIHFVCVCNYWLLTCLSIAVPCGVGWPVLLNPSITLPFIPWQGEHGGVWLIIETSLSSECLSSKAMMLSHCPESSAWLSVCTLVSIENPDSVTLLFIMVLA